MTFVSPLFLWALTAIAAPIVIHLFNFRKYQKVYFTNVKFLKDLQVESKSKSRLKEILVLVARCLAIACLVLAFSQPFIPYKSGTTPNSASQSISVYIDNSFSMQNINKQGPILELAKMQAKELVNVLGNGDKFQILTNDFEGKHQRFLYKEDALNAIDEIKISSAVRTISDVLKRQTDFLKNAGNVTKKIYLFSDAQRSTFDLLNCVPDTAIQTTLIPLQANLEKNVYIDTCWFETPLQQKGFVQKLHARIVNAAGSEIESSSARLFLNKQQIAMASFSVEANSKTELIFSFECKQNGLNYGSIKIEDYPVSFDDELFFAFNSEINMDVCMVNGKDQNALNFFSSLFKNDSLFKLSILSEQSIDFNLFKTSDVLIINQLKELSSGLISELLKFKKRGGALVLIPSEGISLANFNQALTALNLPVFQILDSLPLKTEKIELNSEFYRSVFEKLDERLNLPLVNKHYPFNKNKFTDFEPLLLLQNGDAFFGRQRSENCFVYLFSSPLNESYTNFTKHALFVPTFYQIAFSSLSYFPLFYPVSTNQMIQFKSDPLANEQPPHIQRTDKTDDIIPEVRNTDNVLSLFTQQQISEPGFYELIQSERSILPLAFNYTRIESELLCYTPEELSKIIRDKNWSSLYLIDGSQTDFSHSIIQGNEGIRLWKLFIILALFFLVLETVLLRLLN